MTAGKYCVVLALAGAMMIVQGCSGDEQLGTRSASELGAPGPIRYSYDPLGRLVQAAAADGTGVQYSYDPVGNITAIRRLAANTLTIADFAPHTGPSGIPITIYGGGFDPVTSNNTVTFNGIAAPVNSATATTLGVVVPVEATSGKIAVSNTLGNVTTAVDFVVSSVPSVPAITAFTPVIGAQGTVVTMSGANFQSNARDDSVEIDGQAASVVVDASGPTATQLKFVVPSATASGPIALTTPFGRAVSATEFVAVPSTVNAGDVEFSGHLSVNGPPVTVTTTGAGKKAVLSFTGAASQGLHLVTQGGTFASAVTADVYAADGSKINTLSLINNGVADFTNQLTDFTNRIISNGIYSVILSPVSSDHGTVQLSLIADVMGELVLDGAPAPTTIIHAGQNARYTFSGTAGQMVTLVLTNNALDDGNSSTNNNTVITVYAPTAQLASTGITTNKTSATLDMTLPETGTYGVVLDPTGLDVGTINVQVVSCVTGSLAMDSSTPVNLSAGQNGRFTFTAQANTGYGLALTGLTFTPGAGTVNITLRKSDGTSITTGTFFASGSTIFAPGNFLTTGTYLLDFDPSGVNATTFNAVLSSDITGTIPIDSDPLPVTFVRPGQNARYSFAGAAGQSVTLVFTGNTLDDGNLSTINSTGLSVLTANGASIFSGAINTGVTGLPIDLTLPETGIYTLLIDPSGLDVGTINVQVKTFITGALTLDTNTPVNLSAGQKARLMFTAEAGKGYGLIVPDVTFTPSGAGLNAVVSKADGTTLATCRFTTADSCDLDPGTFPVTGNYKIDFTLGGLNAASFTVALLNDVTGVLTVGGGQTSVTLTRAGQNALYSFAGTAAQVVTVIVSKNMLDDGNPNTFNTTLVKIFNSNNSLLSSGSFRTGVDGVRLIMTLPQTGNYAIEVAPSRLDSGTFNLEVQ